MRLPVALAFVLASAGSAQADGSVTEKAEQLADDILRRLPVRDAPVALRLRASIDDAPRSDELGAALQAAWLDALRARGVAADRLDRSDDLDTDDAAALAESRGYRAFVDVDVGRRAQALRATVQIFRAGREGTAAAHDPAPERTASLTVPLRLDAHLRSYVGRMARLEERAVRSQRFALSGSGYLGVAAGDVDGDGTDEIAVLRTDRVDVLRFDRRRIRAVGWAPLTGLAPAGIRSRRPIATLYADGATFAGRTSEHGGGFRIRVDGGRVTAERSGGGCPDDTYPLADACARRVDGRDYFHAELTRRDGAAANAPSGFYARVHRRVFGDDGSQRDVEIVITPRGRIAARVGEARGGAAGYGAALAMADLDQDGRPELLTSAPVMGGEPDRLVVLRVREDGALLSFWSSDPLSGAVFVAGRGDVDGDGLEELIAIEEPVAGERHAHLWVIR